MNGFDFDSKGYLIPADVIEISRDVFEETFIFSYQRAEIYGQFKQMVSAIKELGVRHFDVWIDGSFATLKVAPEDIDVICFIDWTSYETHEIKLRLLRSKFENVDVYFVKSYPPEHPSYFLTNFDIADWRSFFSRDRHNYKKGILNLTISDETL
jgi:hypothetical protein